MGKEDNSITFKREKVGEFMFQFDDDKPVKIGDIFKGGTVSLSFDPEGDNSTIVFTGEGKKEKTFKLFIEKIEKDED